MMVLSPMLLFMTGLSMNGCQVPLSLPDGTMTSFGFGHVMVAGGSGLYAQDLETDEGSLT